MPTPVYFPQIDAAGKWNTTIQQGSSFIRSIFFDDFDITGFGFRGHIKKNFKDRRPLAVYSTTIINNTELLLELTPSESEKLIAPAKLYHDIEMFYFDEEAGKDVYVARIFEGKLKITPEVTKRI